MKKILLALLLVCSTAFAQIDPGVDRDYRQFKPSVATSQSVVDAEARCLDLAGAKALTGPINASQTAVLKASGTMALRLWSDGGASFTNNINAGANTVWHSGNSFQMKSDASNVYLYYDNKATKNAYIQVLANDGDYDYEAGLFLRSGTHNWYMIKQSSAGAHALVFKFDATTKIVFYNTGAAYFDNYVSALSFTDRTPFPKDKAEAYAIVQSHEEDPSQPGQLNHKKLHASASVHGTKKVKKQVGCKTVEVEEEELGRNLSLTVSAQAAVIKDLIKRIEALEAK